MLDLSSQDGGLPVRHQSWSQLAAKRRQQRAQGRQQTFEGGGWRGAVGFQKFFGWRRQAVFAHPRILHPGIIEVKFPGFLPVCDEPTGVEISKSKEAGVARFHLPVVARLLKTGVAGIEFVEKIRIGGTQDRDAHFTFRRAGEPTRPSVTVGSVTGIVLFRERQACLCIARYGEIGYQELPRTPLGRSAGRPVMYRTYCTLSDLRYLARTLAAIRSLRRVVPDAQVWLLCLDEETHRLMARKAEPGIHLVAMEALEAEDPQLAEARNDGRNTIAFYFSCKPSLITYVFRHVAEADFVSYLDGDLYFFSDPEPFFAEAGNAPVLLTPHRFPPSLEHLRAHGIFNAGYLSFRRNADGLACLDWWRRKCIDWCFDWLDEEGERHGDQRYLDKFSELFPSTFISHHLGANLAPWNIGSLRLDDRDGQILIENRYPLVFFHFHGLKALGPCLYQTSHDVYHAPLTPLMRRHIYRPYLGELRAIDRELAPDLGAAAGKDLARAPTATFLVDLLKKTVRLVRSWAGNALIRMPARY